MASAQAKDKLKGEVASSRPRDEKGHFIKVPGLSNLHDPLSTFLASHTGNYKDQEDLLDIRIGNPLRRVIELLEEIKNQKAFSFTLKGSLGIAGVILVLSVFGLFGGNRVICDKGVQTHIGTIKVLNYREIYNGPLSLIDTILMVHSSSKIINRTILVKTDGTTLNIPFNENINLVPFNNTSVLVTGSFNSCSETLSINDASGIELNH